MPRPIGRRLRGGLDVAFAALERAAGSDRRPAAPRAAARAGGPSRVPARPLGGRGAAPARRAPARRFPPHEAARASFDLETLTRAWSAASTIRRFARIAEDLADRGDDQRRPRSARRGRRCGPTGTSWTTARGTHVSACRRRARRAGRRSAASGGARAHRSGQSGPRGHRPGRADLSGRHARTRPVDGRRPGRDRPYGPTTSPSRSSAPRLPDTGPTAGWRGLPSASCSRPGPASTAARCASRSPPRPRPHGSPRRRASSATCSPRSSPMPSPPPSGATRKRPSG